jgi:hypothetical protein
MSSSYQYTQHKQAAMCTCLAATAANVTRAEILDWIDTSNHCLYRNAVSDESTFHIRHNVGTGVNVTDKTFNHILT